MYSLNVPVPGEVSRLASELHPRLVAFDRVRERHTLVLKRFERGSLPELQGTVGDADVAALQNRLREALAGAPAVEARIARIDRFEDPLRGSAPVVYLAVESPGLDRLHRRLVDRFGAVEGLEGSTYTPHVTLARGGPSEAARRLTGPVEPVTWTAASLDLHSAEYRETVGSVSLPV